MGQFKRHPTLTEFKKAQPKMYAKLKKDGLFSQFCKDFGYAEPQRNQKEKQREKYRELLVKYSKLFLYEQDFIKKYKEIHEKFVEYGWQEEFKLLIEENVKLQILEKVRNIKKGYDFIDNYPKLYEAAKHYGWLEEMRLIIENNDWLNSEEAQLFLKFQQSEEYQIAIEKFRQTEKFKKMFEEHSNFRKNLFYSYENS